MLISQTPLPILVWLEPTSTCRLLLLNVSLVSLVSSVKLTSLKYLVLKAGTMTMMFALYVLLALSVLRLIKHPLSVQLDITKITLEVSIASRSLLGLQ